MEGSQRNNRRHLAVEVLEDRTLLAASSLSSYLSLPSSLAAAVSYAAAHQPSAGPDLRELLLSEAAAAAGGRLLSADGHAMGYDRDALLDALFDRPGEERRTTLMDILNLPSSAEPRPEGAPEAPERALLPPALAAETAAPTSLGAPSSGRVVDATGGIGLASRGGAPVDESAAPPPSSSLPAPEGRGPLASEPPPEAQPGQPLPISPAISLAPKAAALLEGGLPIDLPALKQNVDDFFARLAGSGERRDGCRWVRFGPWLIVVAAGAFEMARRWERQTVRRTVPGGEIVPRPTAPLSEDE